MDKPSWDKVKWRLIGNHLGYSKDELDLFKANPRNEAVLDMGFTVTAGNNVYINLEPDTRGETERLFTALAAGGTVEMPLQEMFWGGYFGSLADRYGIRWMFNCDSKT